MTAFRPGQSPPPVSTPTRMAAPRGSRSLDRSQRRPDCSGGSAAAATVAGPGACTAVARLPGMTFSIVARSLDGQSWGVAVASKFLAVGSAVPAAVAGVGAIATQADANVAYKGLALAHLDDGATAAVALQRLIEDD